MPLDFSHIIEQVRAFTQEEHLWNPGERMLLAVSGGPDSVAMLDIVSQLGDDLRLVVGHVNHSLRPEAVEDAAFVANLAAGYGLPFFYRQVDVPARVAETGESVEEAARALRYAALFEMAEESSADRLATGHTADDQAETVLMRVLRGAGLAGLAGIPVRRDRVVRPLLILWRRQIMDYLRERDLSFRTDLSNYSLEFTRNRIRQELLPLLEREYAPRLRERLLNLGQLAGEDNAVLEAIAEREFARLCHLVPDGLALPDAPDLPLAICRRLWRRAILQVRRTLDGISFAHLEVIRRLPLLQEVHLPGVRVVHEAGRLVFLPGGREISPVAIPDQPLPLPGHWCDDAAGCCLATDLLPSPPPIAGGDIALLDARAVAGPLHVRSWHPGDRYQPLGAPGSRKIQDIFVDAGLPKRLRSRIPLVLDAKGIVWLAGFRIADRVKMLSTTSQTLRFNITWLINPWTLTPSVGGR